MLSPPSDGDLSARGDERRKLLSDAILQASSMVDKLSSVSRLNQCAKVSPRLNYWGRTVCFRAGESLYGS